MMSDLPILHLMRTGMFDIVNDEEHALHELCHAAILAVPRAGSNALSSISSLVSDAIRGLSPHRGDWNEILTCAAEIRAAMLLGWEPLDAELILGGNVYGDMSESYAVKKIQDLVWTEASYRRARKALQLAESLYLADVERGRIESSR